VIGVCSSLEDATWRVWKARANLSPRAYSVAISQAGGITILLPPDDAVAEAPDQVLDLIDGLILAGGADVDPASYGAKPHPETGLTWPERDRFELALAHRAIERDIPVLGICRGMQLLNVACGGTLDQHLPDTLGSDLHCHTVGTYSDHGVTLDRGSRAAESVGGEHTEVKSHHHQGVDELGEGLVVSGRADPDGVIEAIEMPDKRYVVGVIWHPEEDERSRVVGSFVEACRARVGAA
jgi:putative glutamine amidotransferase